MSRRHILLSRFALAALCVVGCKRRVDGPSGPMSKMQRDRTIQRAIRSSSEGVILLPSGKADQVYELPRLNEIAQELRQPAAACFLAAALQTMERADTDAGWSGVPDGQVKIRARIAASGEVVSAEVIESGFATPAVPECVAEAVKLKRFPENQSGTTHYIDIVYWVSLGMQSELRGEGLAQHLRREQAEAGLRAKACLQGRVPEGAYAVEGLNLVGRDGATMANRIDQAQLPEEVRTCVTQAFRDIRLPAAPQSFVRPVAPQARFDVLPEGRVRVKDEEWLRLVKLEERAQRDRKAAELADSAAEVPADRVDVVEEPSEEESPVEDQVTDEAPEGDAADPGKGGHKLDLSGRRGGQ